MLHEAKAESPRGRCNNKFFATLLLREEFEKPFSSLYNFWKRGCHIWGETRERFLTLGLKGEKGVSSRPFISIVVLV